MPSPRRYPRWLWWAIVLFLRHVVTGWVWSLTGRAPRAFGRDLVPRTGGLLLLANHISDADPILVQWACPRPIHFLAKSELFEMRGLGTLMRVFQAFPVRRDVADRAALRRAAELVRLGEVVCVFPEGQLSDSGELQPLQPGWELIARLSRGPVQCVGVAGTNGFLPYGETRPRRSARPVTLRFGEVGPPDVAEELRRLAEPR